MFFIEGRGDSLLLGFFIEGRGDSLLLCVSG
jgi:hypothetical protein